MSFRSPLIQVKYGFNLKASTAKLTVQISVDLTDATYRKGLSKTNNY